MRRGTGSATLLLVLGPALAGCGPDWQPSWNMSSRPTVTADSLTVRRVLGEETEVAPLRRESMEQIRLSAGELQSNAPRGPEAALTGAPDYRPVPRPEVDAMTRSPSATTPAAPEAPPPRRAGSSTPPPVTSVPPRATVPERPRVTAPPLPPLEREEGRIVQIPGQPPGTVTGGTGRVQSFTQPGSADGGVAIRDGGTTTVIQPGGRVTTIPTPR